MTPGASSTSMTLHAAGSTLRADNERRPAGFLFECAPDGAACALLPHALPLRAFLGDGLVGVKDAAYALCRALLEGEPRYEGTAFLSVHEEQVIAELVRALAFVRIAGALREQRIDDVAVEGHAWIAQGIADACLALGTRIRVAHEGSRGPSEGRLTRVWRRLAASGFSARTAAREWRQLLRHVDPYQRLQRRRHRPIAKGRPWAYSTAENYTRILSLYEPWVEGGFEFLVENAGTGGAPLKAAGRSFDLIHQCGSRSMEPSTRDIDALHDSIVRHVSAVQLSNELDLAARAIFMSGAFMRQFRSKLLAQGVFMARLFREWVGAVRPSALFVGNPVFEGYALQAVRQSGAPTVLLQHGILGDFCQYVDPPADHYVVRGTFWRDFLSRAAARRAVVLNPPAGNSDPATTPRGRDILFLTAPYHLQWLFHESDLDDILRALAGAAAARECALVVRVHPLEDVGSYRRRIDSLLGGGAPAIRFSQGGPIDADLDSAAVAVTFSSTVFLDCLRRRIPVVSFAWHDFSYKAQVEGLGVFHFARNLSHLRDLAESAIEGRLPAYDGGAEPFLAATSGDEVRSALSHMVSRPVSDKGRTP